MKSSANKDHLNEIRLIEKHYTPGNLMEKITEALRKEGKNIESIKMEDLTPAEEFHIRGREATRQLVERLKINSESKVLDLGSGIGGMSRYVASQYNCRVTGIDLSDEFCSVARELNRRVGLDDKVTFYKADAIRIPFENREFDFVLTQHVQMNIADKEKLASEIYRVLKPGGYFALHDIFSNPGAANPDFPVPWAETEKISFLTEWNSYKSIIERTGLQLTEEEDVTAPGIAWFNAMVEKTAQTGQPPVSIQLVMGENAPIKIKNVGKALDDKLISVYQAVFRKI